MNTVCGSHITDDFQGHEKRPAAAQARLKIIPKSISEAGEAVPHLQVNQGTHIPGPICSCREPLESSGCLHEITRKKVSELCKQNSACSVASLLCFQLLVHILHSLSRNSSVRFTLAREFLVSLGYPVPLFVHCPGGCKGCGSPDPPEGYHITNLILQQQPDGLFRGAYIFYMVQNMLVHPGSHQSSFSRNLYFN